MILHLREEEPGAPFGRLADLLGASSFDQVRQILKHSRSKDARALGATFVTNVSGDSKLAAWILTDMATRFMVLRNPTVRELLASDQNPQNDLNFIELVNRPQALFILIPARAAGSLEADYCPPDHATDDPPHTQPGHTPVCLLPRLMTADEVRRMHRRELPIVASNVAPMRLRSRPYFRSRRLRKLTALQPLYVSPHAQATSVSQQGGQPAASQSNSQAGGSRHRVQQILQLVHRRRAGSPGHVKP